MCCGLPVLSRCCFCIPLRTGLIVWGYLRMIVAVSYLFLILHKVGTHFSAKGLAILLALLSFLVANVVFSIMFVIGLHKKNYKLLRIYYSFSIFALFLTSVAYLILITVQIVLTLSNEEESHTGGRSTLLINVSTVINIFLDLYFIILTRTEILKLKNQRTYYFNNKYGETSVVLEIPIPREHDTKCDAVYTDSESEEEVPKKPLFPVQELERLKTDLVNRRM